MVPEKSLRRGYDFDGVLCESAPISGDKYRILTDEEFQARKEELRIHHLTAQPLLVPEPGPFYVVTGRRQELYPQAADWLERHYPGRWKLIMHHGYDRSYEEIMRFKAMWIQALDLHEFTDDSPDIVKDLKFRLPNVKIIQFQGSIP